MALQGKTCETIDHNAWEHRATGPGVLGPRARADRNTSAKCGRAFFEWLRIFGVGQTGMQPECPKEESLNQGPPMYTYRLHRGQTGCGSCLFATAFPRVL